VRLRSPTQTRDQADDYARDFRRLVTVNRAELDKTSDPPLVTLHKDELQ
jgi:hypothetical protein